MNLDDYQLDPNCLKYINYSDARRYKIIPLFKIENTLTVAMADPRDLFAIDKIMETAECEIDPVLSSEESILKKLMNITRLMSLLEISQQMKIRVMIGKMNCTKKI